MVNGAPTAEVMKYAGDQKCEPRELVSLRASAVLELAQKTPISGSPQMPRERFSVGKQSGDGHGPGQSHMRQG